MGEGTRGTSCLKVVEQPFASVQGENCRSSQSHNSQNLNVENSFSLHKVKEMNIDNKISWVSCAIDGEGMVSWYIAYDKPRELMFFVPCVEVVNTAKSFIDLWVEILKEEGITSGRWKQGNIYRARVKGQRQTKKLLCLVKGSLVVKHKHADILLKFIVSREKQIHKRREERGLTSAEARMLLKIRELNKRGFNKISLKMALEKVVEEGTTSLKTILKNIIGSEDM